MTAEWEWVRLAPTTQSIATTAKIVRVVANDCIELVKNGMQGAIWKRYTARVEISQL